MNKKIGYKIMKKRIISFTFLTLIALSLTVFLQSCGNSGKNKVAEKQSIETIHQKEGVPVTIQEIQPEELTLTLSYLSSLMGSKQATVTSMVADKIEKVKARVGSRVAENQVVVQFPLDNPTLQYQQAKVSYENYKKTYERMKALLEAGETSQQNFDNIETQYLVAKRNYESIQQMLFVQSPISGTIVEIPYKEGEKVRAGDKLFTVAQIDRMKAVFWVSDQDLPHLRNGMNVTIEKNGKVYPGRISEISLVQDQTRKAFKVEAEFPNKNRELYVGMTMDVLIPYYINPNAIVVPRSALIQQGGKYYVFLAIENTAKMQEVKIGQSRGDKVEIFKGLNPGDKVITEGVNLLSDGSKISYQN
ncbi:MAG TPA: efflux RND transporter periplasmic adaptor subunit [Candidatus Kapabacteria bacterium]|nr:efflux RND transporter periplasmic adaptor subunit [Candidatus Kapabacteria bacterium]